MDDTSFILASASESLPHNAQLPPPQPLNSFAKLLGRWGSWIGVALIYPLPRINSFLYMGAIGAICGASGAFLGNAIGHFIDELYVKETTPTDAPGQSRRVIASLIFGIIGLVAWLFPIVGLPLTVSGFIISKNARRAAPSKLALVSMAMSLLGLLLSAGNAYLGAVLAGQ